MSGVVNLAAVSESDLAALRQTINDLSSKIASTVSQSDLSVLQTSLSDMTSKIANAASKTDLSSVESTLSTVNSKVQSAAAQADLLALQTALATISSKVTSVASQSDIASMQTTLSNINSQLTGFGSKTDVDSLKTGLTAVNSFISANPIPQPSTTVPPGVQDSSNVGSSTTRFALADHTHASKARKEIKSVTTSGVFTWTFPTAFASGVIPVCNGIAICPAGTTDFINVQQEGDATNTSVKFRITRYQQSVASVLGLTILSLNSSSFPTGLKLSLLALEP